MVHDDGPVGLDGVRSSSMTSGRSLTPGWCWSRRSAQRLGIEALVGAFVASASGWGRRNAGRKVMTLVSAMVLGADCIDDCDVLRSGRTGGGARAPGAAPSTLGTFLRAFTFGHVRQLDRVLAEALARAWAAGAGPGDRAAGRRCRLASSVRFTATPSRARRSATPAARLSPDPGDPRRHRRGAAHPAAQGLGEHVARDRALPGRADRPRRARRRDRRRSCCAPIRGSGTSRRSPGSTGPAGSSRSASACSPHVRAAIDAIAEDAWQTLRRLPADRRSRRSPRPPSASRRLIVRRVRTLDRPRRAAADLGAVPVRHQPHRRARDSSRPSTASTPSSSSRSATSKTKRSRTSRPASFTANAAWTVIAALAHNLLRWTSVIGLPGHTIRDRPHRSAADCSRSPAA